jgi:hypothetical protein
VCDKFTKDVPILEANAGFQYKLEPSSASAIFELPIPALLASTVILVN